MMEFLNQNIEVVKLIGTLLAALLGGGGVAYITLPLMLEKMRADISKSSIETAASALDVAQQATKLAQTNDLKINDLMNLIGGDLSLSGQFSMEELVKNGSAKLSGTVVRLKRISLIDG